MVKGLEVGVGVVGVVEVAEVRGNVASRTRSPTISQMRRFAARLAAETEEGATGVAVTEVGRMRVERAGEERVEVARGRRTARSIA